MMELHPLLEYLSTHLPAGPVEWQGWQVQRVPGGRTNLLFRAARGQDDLVVKFTRRDERDRAGREFHALRLMQDIAPGLAPIPVLLERERYPYQVVVQRWMEGEARDEPPGTPLEWQRLVDHYTAVHAVTPQQVEPERLAALKPAVLTFNHAPDAVRFLLADAANLTPPAWTDELRGLMHSLETAQFPNWPDPPCTFDRCDPYIANFLRYADGRPWASVDWENSGWGDPAFEIGDLMAHPCYKEVPAEQWAGFLRACANTCPADAAFATRARAYYAIVLVRYARLFAGFVYKRERGDLDAGRLVPWPKSWWDGVPEDYRHYLEAAKTALAAYRP